MMIEAFLWAGDAAGPLYAQAAKITEGATVITSRTTAPALASAVLDSSVTLGRLRFLLHSSFVVA